MIVSVVKPLQFETKKLSPNPHTYYGKGCDCRRRLGQTVRIFEGMLKIPWLVPGLDETVGSGRLWGPIYLTTQYTSA